MAEPVRVRSLTEQEGPPAQTQALHASLRWRNATPAIPTSWPFNAENGPASAARRAFAGADARSLARPDSTSCTSPPTHRRIQRSHS